MKPVPPEELHRAHEPEAIAQRLDHPGERQYVSDAVLGGIDGCVTTFAVVAGSVGAGFAPRIALVLGLANLLADGFSMAVSNYQAETARREHREKMWRQEDEHIEAIPEGEREEIRQIFARKGFSGDTLEHIVSVITADRGLWIETMLAEEYGLERAQTNPYRSALTTFAAFLFVGLIPLVPFMVGTLSSSVSFRLSGLLAALVFFSIGAARSIAFHRPILRSALSTLVTGGAAAALAYAVGYVLREIFHIA